MPYAILGFADNRGVSGHVTGHLWEGEGEDAWRARFEYWPNCHPGWPATGTLATPGGEGEEGIDIRGLNKYMYSSNHTHTLPHI